MRKALKIIIIVASVIIVACVLAVTLYLNPFLFRAPSEEISWVNQELSGTDFDVIVVGAEPEGIAAAVAAARSGMNTLLLGKDSALGGLMTLGQLNFIDMCHGSDGTLLTKGFFEEFYTAVGGSAFDITEAKNFFTGTVTSEPLLTLRTESHLVAPIMVDNGVTGVRMLENGAEIVYTGRRFIDATADGDLAAMTGAPYTYGGEDIGQRDLKMGVTLIFELSGVSWTKVFFHLNFQRLAENLAGRPSTVGATNKVAWGYEEEGFSYVSKDPMVRFRGPNIARQRNGTVLLNALVVFDVNPLDPESYRDAIGRAKAELEYIVPYMRENFAGFENARLFSTAEKLYVRETRHFIGEYQLTIDDVLENRDHWDKIAIGSYPADVQASILQPYGTVIGNPDRYAVPFRCLIPLNIENLLIVGRSASFTSQASSSARVIPLGMACGQAAGAAAAQSVSENISFRRMSADPDSIVRLQAALRSQGAFLEDFTIIEPIMTHWAYSSVAELRSIGLVYGGYRNDYQLDTSIERWRFQSILNGVVRRAGLEIDAIDVGPQVTNGRIIDLVASVVLEAKEPGGLPESQLAGARSHSENLDVLIGAGILDQELTGLFNDSANVPLAAEVIVLLANLYNSIRA